MVHGTQVSKGIERTVDTLTKILSLPVGTDKDKSSNDALIMERAHLLAPL